jgi:hypothetical protein
LPRHVRIQQMLHWQSRDSWRRWNWRWKVTVITIEEDSLVKWCAMVFLSWNNDLSQTYRKKGQGKRRSSSPESSEAKMLGWFGFLLFEKISEPIKQLHPRMVKYFKNKTEILFINYICMLFPWFVARIMIYRWGW